MFTGKASGEIAPRVFADLIRHVTALVFCFATTACAHAPSGSSTSPPKEPAAMNAPAANVYHPHTLDEFPELTPEEIGRRFLKLIDSLKTPNDLTLEHLQEVMRLRLTPSPETHGGFFTIHLPESGWYYGVSYYNDPALHRKNASYNFLNDENRQSADMAPVCSIDFNAYVTELKKMGFVEREDLTQYDSPMPPMNEDGTMAERRVFRLPVYFFSRGTVKVVIRERSEALISARRETDPPDDKLNHACIESIGVGEG